MEMLLAWLSMNWVSVLVCVVFIVGAIYLWKQGYKSNVSLYILTLIAKAEAEFEHGENKEKLESVITGVHDRFPGIIKFFYSRDDLVKLINQMVADTKSWLQNQSR